MDTFALLAQIGMPVALAVGAILAWRVSKRDSASGHDGPAWRDDSLDDWRRERDADAQIQREVRAQTPASARETTEQTEHHNRLGG